MARQLRRMVTTRAALCDLVAGAAQVQGPEIGEKLGKVLSPTLAEGEEPPELGLPIELFSRRLRSFCDAMVDADAKYLAERAALADLRLEAEAPTRKLMDSILSLRSTCEGLLGKESLRPLGLDFKLAREPRGVLRQGEIIRQQLLSSDNELVPDRWVQGLKTRQELATEFDEEIDALTRTVKGLVEQSKVVDTAKVRKDQTREEFDRQFVPIARFFEATFRVAGETELADRIRPTVRQLGRDDGKETEEEAAEEAEAEAPPASEPPAVTAEAPGPAS